MKTERLTARSPKNNMAYLVNVKSHEQDVESPYPHTLRCITEAFEKLAQYEESFQNPGEISDGYHTFNELYHHRAVLFSIICNQNNKIAWKSPKHSDGTMYEGMFIVGINTPFGQATYHYDINPYWNYFDVPMLEKAPEWDGHTPKEAIDRLLFFGFNFTRGEGR